MTDHTKYSPIEDARTLARVNHAIQALGTDARGGMEAPLVAIGPPGYEVDVAGKPISSIKQIEAEERAMVEEARVKAIAFAPAFSDEDRAHIAAAMFGQCWVAKKRGMDWCICYDGDAAGGSGVLAIVMDDAQVREYANWNAFAAGYADRRFSW